MVTDLARLWSIALDQGNMDAVRRIGDVLVRLIQEALLANQDRAKR